MYEACHRSFQHGDNSGLEEVVQAAVRQGNQDRAHQQFHKQFIEELDEGYKI
jgi:hypothetical protein